MGILNQKQKNEDGKVKKMFCLKAFRGFKNGCRMRFSFPFFLVNVEITFVCRPVQFVGMARK